MAIAQGTCPNCGAPTEFRAGASVSKVCPYCRHVILRTDRDWQNLGRAADLANTPSTLAVGDRGTVRGVAFEVVGRVQLDYGHGPWDEFYVAFSDGSWGWIAEAQGNLYVTRLISEALPVPPAQTLTLDGSVPLGRYGVFRVAERRSARVLTAEGELPGRPAPERFYADLHGPGGAFATLDYGDGRRAPEVFIGHQVPFAEVQVVPHGGERGGAQQVKLEAITCPACGGALPAPKDRAIERIACRYCNAVSDLASLQVIARQAAARERPRIKLGATGTLGGAAYTVIGYVERSATIEGERFCWQEYLLYGEQVGFRWLVHDEGTWLFVRPLSSVDVQASGYAASWERRSFTQRNDNQARVDYVLGEFYWKVTVGETVHATDFVSGNDVLSREVSDGEVSWSYGTPVSWHQIVQAFSVNDPAAPPIDVSQFSFNTPSDSTPKPLGFVSTVLVVLIVLSCLCVLAMVPVGSGGSDDSYSSGSYSSGSSGVHISGGGSYGGFGGK